MENNNMKIFVSFYKDYPIDKNISEHPDIFLPIFTGSEINNRTDFLSKIIQDNTGENVSAMNKYLSEFTALYWAKYNYCNQQDIDYIGFNHYRRIFDYNDIKDYREYDIICYNNILGCCKIPQRTLYSNFAGSHNSRYLDIVLQNYSKLNEDFGKYLLQNVNSDRFYPKVCFIMKKHIFEELFDKVIVHLKDFKSMLNISDNDDGLIKRLPAYIGERLVSIFIQYKHEQGCKVKFLNIDNNLI